jgi:glycosyltransferase involved in cell wall biosynthesis
MAAPVVPLIPEVGVLAIPYHAFTHPWTTPHQVLTRLANYFHVVWLEPAHHWRESNSWSAHRAEISRAVRDVPSSFTVHVPELWLPDVLRPPWVNRSLFNLRVRRAWRQLRKRGCRQLVLHLWHPRFEPALTAGKHQLSLYHIDDEYTFVPEPGPMGDQERRVIRSVDHVFAVSPGLMERKGGINPQLTFVPHGVDFALYSTPAPEPADIASIPHPRIGYTGIVKRTLDWELLSQLAHTHAEWSFVFVGPRSLDEAGHSLVEQLRRLPNVHLLGRKTVSELAAYPQHFDVCIMPYSVNGYTNNIFPLKLHEYLASGRPIVASAIRSLQEFSGAITLAETVAAWSNGISYSLNGAAQSHEATLARQAIARQSDWSETIYNLAAAVCQHLGPEYLQRLRSTRLADSETRPIQVPFVPA